MTTSELIEAIENLTDNTDDPDTKKVLYALLDALYSGHEMQLAAHILPLTSCVRDILIQERSRLN